MALIKCIECGRDISDRAISCPYCGIPSSFQQNAGSQSFDLSTGSTADLTKQDSRWEIVNQLLQDESRVAAIKMIQDITGKSLMESKGIADKLDNKLNSTRPVVDTEREKADRLRMYVDEAKTYPERSVRCAKCHTPYPRRLSQCPGCGITNQNENIKEMLSIAGRCPTCGKQISTQATACPGCGHPTGVHVCPKCGSTNTKVISGASKTASVFLWGSFAANKVVSKYQCKDCWHKW